MVYPNSITLLFVHTLETYMAQVTMCEVMEHLLLQLGDENSQNSLNEN